jgi:hypothetical protein
MAEEKTPERKSRREALYDNATSRKARAEPAAKPAAKEAEAKPAVSREHAEMLRRHENERRDLHGRHRTEHRALDAEPGPETHQKKVSAHRRHEGELSQMHEKHEKELIDKLAAMHKEAA